MSLREFEGERVVIWPVYFLGESRRKGRRFKLIQKISVNDIIEVSKILGLDPIIINNKYHPADKQYSILIVVKKIKSKQYTLKMIYNELCKRKGLTKT
ncbi:MAG: signal recognition particle protein Srp19 [Sulfolobaceae archaeon]